MPPPLRLGARLLLSLSTQLPACLQGLAGQGFIDPVPRSAGDYATSKEMQAKYGDVDKASGGSIRLGWGWALRAGTASVRLAVHQVLTGDRLSRDNRLVQQHRQFKRQVAGVQHSALHAHSGH